MVECIFVDSSANEVFQCLSDVICYANCVYSDSYGVSDCSIDPQEFISRDRLRYQLCESIINTTSYLDKSSFKLENLIG